MSLIKCSRSLHIHRGRMMRMRVNLFSLLPLYHHCIWRASGGQQLLDPRIVELSSCSLRLDLLLGQEVFCGVGGELHWLVGGEGEGGERGGRGRRGGRVRGCGHYSINLNSTIRSRRGGDLAFVGLRKFNLEE